MPVAEAAPKAALITLQATEPYRAWLRGLARRVRSSQAGVVDRALEALAGQVGYPSPPPRLPGHHPKETPADAR